MGHVLLRVLLSNQELIQGLLYHLLQIVAGEDQLVGVLVHHLNITISCRIRA